MIELAKKSYLDEILFGAKDSKERFEILSFIELTFGFDDTEELVKYLNTHLASRMFLVGQNITCADIIAYLSVAAYFKELMDFQKIEMANCFRWVDHIQHLPGIFEQANQLSIFVSFPDENNAEPSKA